VLLRREGWQGERQTDLSAVDGRRADGVAPTPHEGRGPSLCAATRGDRPEPAVEYGLHERARGGWRLVSDSDRRGPVHEGDAGLEPVVMQRGAPRAITVATAANLPVGSWMPGPTA
jgi:hypothetical protein